VGSEVEQELDDRWWIGLVGRTVESIDTHEFNVVVSFGRGTALTIESAADVQASPRQPGTPAVSMNQDGSVFASNALLSLAGQKVVSGVAFKTGALPLVFESGARLTVPFGEEHETWQPPVRQGVCGFHSQAMASPPSRAPNNDALSCRGR
jgi:hypothetical protein